MAGHPETVPPQTAPGRRHALGALLGLCLTAATGLAGCGFRLRGTTALHFATLHTDFPPGSLVGAELRRQLERSAGTRLVATPGEADVRLRILEDSRDSTILTYSAVGRIRQFELWQRLRYQAFDRLDQPLGPADEIQVRRELGASDNNLTTRPDEGLLLDADMVRDVVQQLLRRLERLPLTGQPTPSADPDPA